MNTKQSVTGRAKDAHIITIQETSGGNTYSSSNPIGAGDGSGTAGTVNYNPTSNPIISTKDVVTGYANPATRPPQIGLAHELIHADHAREGTMEGYLDAAGNPHLTLGTYTYIDSSGVSNTVNTTQREELRTVGLGYTSTGDITENQIRQDSGLSERVSY